MLTTLNGKLTASPIFLSILKCLYKLVFTHSQHNGKVTSVQRANLLIRNSYTHQWHSHRDQFEGHFAMQTRRARKQTTNLLIGRRFALPTELHPPLKDQQRGAFSHSTKCRSREAVVFCCSVKKLCREDA